MAEGWTEARVETLRSLWAEGQSASHIAARLGEVTRNAVIGKVHRLGLPGRKTTSRRQKPRASTWTHHPRRARPWRPAAPNGSVAAIPPLRPTEPEPMDIGVLELTAGRCKWPSGDPRAGHPYRFCGHAAAASYCDFHDMRAHR